MTNWTHQQKPDNELMSSFPTPEVKKYLGINDGVPSDDPARWLLDSYQLIQTSWPNTYGDYSFIVVPASKALENWIFKLASDLNIEVKTDRARKLGRNRSARFGDCGIKATGYWLLALCACPGATL